MLKSLVYLLTSTVLVIFLGLFNSKLVANYLPYEYIGYFGFVKSNAVFLSSILLFGLNYSFFFIEKNKLELFKDKEKSVSYTFSHSVVLSTSLYILLCFTFSVLYLVNESLNILLLLISVFCSGIISLTSLYCKRDASKSEFAKFWKYNLVIGVYYFFVIMSMIFLNASKYVIFGSLIFAFFISVFRFFSFVYNTSFSDFFCFFKSNFNYSKLFQLNLILSTGFLALIQNMLLSDEVKLTEFNSIVTLVSLLNIIGTVVGNYLFPRLVSDNNNNEHLMLYKWIYFALYFVSFLMLFLFDFLIELLFKSNFTSISIIVLILIQSKVFETITGTVGYKYSSNLNFKIIFSGLSLIVTPCVMYFFYLYLTSTSISLLIISILLCIGWYARFVMYLSFSDESVKLKISFPIIVLLLSSLQWFWFYYVQ